MDRVRRFFEIVWQYDVHGLACEISFTFLLTLFPLLVVFVSLLGLIEDPKTINLLTDQIGKILPQPIFQPIEKSIENLTRIKSYNIIALSLLISFFSSLAIFGAISKSLRFLSNDFEKIGFLRGVWINLRMLLISGILIVVYFYAIYGMYLSERYLYRFEKIFMFRKYPLGFLSIISFLIVVSLFSFYYSFIAKKKTSLKKSLPGAIFAGCLCIPLTFGFQWYLTVKDLGLNYSFAYDLLSKMVVLMLYAYINATFFLYGFVWNQSRIDSISDKKVRKSKEIVRIKPPKIHN